MDRSRKIHVRGSIVTPIAGTLQRPKLRELRFPIAQDVLRDAELLRQLTDRQASAGILLTGRHPALAFGNPVAHDLARPERHDPARRNRDLDPRLRVATDTLSLVAKDEASEA